MICLRCNNETACWAHRGAHDSHSWDNKNEQTCVCSPAVVCGLCDNTLLQEHGFVVLDREGFPMQPQGLLN